MLDRSWSSVVGREVWFDGVERASSIAYRDEGGKRRRVQWAGRRWIDDESSWFGTEMRCEYLCIGRITDDDSHVIER